MGITSKWYLLCMGINIIYQVSWVVTIHLPYYYSYGDIEAIQSCSTESIYRQLLLRETTS